jgi:HSP20 family protein
LVLHGKVRPREVGRQASPLLQEYREGDFYRTFTIHESVDSSRIEAEVKNGVLVIHLPKTEAARPRQITVRGQ